MNLSVYSFADCGLHGHGRMFAEDPGGTATLGCAGFAIVTLLAVVACKSQSRTGKSACATKNRYFRRDMKSIRPKTTTGIKASIM